MEQKWLATGSQLQKLHSLDLEKFGRVRDFEQIVGARVEFAR